jgi:hypothetical protein
MSREQRRAGTGCAFTGFLLGRVPGAHASGKPRGQSAMARSCKCNPAAKMGAHNSHPAYKKLGSKTSKSRGQRPLAPEWSDGEALVLRQKSLSHCDLLGRRHSILALDGFAWRISRGVTHEPSMQRRLANPVLDASRPGSILQTTFPTTCVEPLTPPHQIQQRIFRQAEMRLRT